jgi:hypothetical protein
MTSKYYDNLQIAEEPEFNKEGLFDGKMGSILRRW